MKAQIVALGCFTLWMCMFQTVGAQDELPVVSVYQTQALPLIDGRISPGEWDAAGPAVVVSPTQNETFIPADPFGGPSDLSFSFRAMWAEPWTAYFLFEVTDDIAMDAIPGNRWDMDQVEFFMDGNDLQGDSRIWMFEWWEGREPYGKFGASRWDGEFEGHLAVMSSELDELYRNGNGAHAVARAGETGDGANYVVEYAVTLEPMWDQGTFDGTATGAARKIVADETAVKWTACVSDNDNFGDGVEGRSNTVCFHRDSDWRDSTRFADLLFVGPYGPVLRGDFDGNGLVDAADLDQLAEAIRANGPARFDLTGDQLVNGLDRDDMVRNVLETWYGDANLDGVFSSADLVTVFAAGKYESFEQAGWADGDWNGDGVFTSGDLVAAFSDGGYEVGPRAVRAVPEPSTIGFAFLSVLLLRPRIGRRVATGRGR